jgi:hypothetical protein
VTAITEVTSTHRYGLFLEHGAIDRLEWIPAHHFLWYSWGNAEEVRAATSTLLAFSHRDTAVARAIREQLKKRGVSAKPAVSLAKVTKGRSCPGHVGTRENATCGCYQTMAWPPLARQICPVENLEASEARYRMR